jgi:hypothetical protein
MSVRLDKTWLTLNPLEVAKLGGQLGVFQLANGQGEVQYVGCADSRSLFGLRGELEVHLDHAALFRIEITSAYKTRREELLMLHHADHGAYPNLNTELEVRGLGRLSP